MTIVYLAASWLVGIALAKQIDLPWQAIVIVGLLSIPVLFLWRGNRRVRLAAACALALTLGAGRLLLSTPHFDKGSLATYNDVGWVTLEGVVVGEPDERDAYTNLRVRAQRLTLPDKTEVPVKGLVLVKADRFPERSYGDRVQIRGPLETPPVLEDFSYKDYLARQGIHSMMGRAQVTLLEEQQASPILYYVYAFKRHAQSTIASILPEPQAALLTGILLGVETGIPQDLMDDFAATGTTHIIAISGFNITIISGIFYGLARRVFGKNRAFLVATAGVAIYTIFVGASAAVVRAAAMGILYLIAIRLGRATYAPASLAAAAWFMTLLNPFTLWDVGFLLSFAATIGLVLYTEPLEKAFERALTRVTSAERAKKAVGLVSEALLVTTAAQITTTPIILHIFGRLSLITLATNFLILPVQSYLMLSGMVALLLALLFRPAGQIVGWISWVFLTYTIEMVRLTARVPLASVPVKMEGWMVWGYYGLLAGLTWWFKLDKERRRELWSRVTVALRTRLPARMLLGVAAVLLVLGFAFWHGLPDGKLHVVFLDVGQGDAIFIETPSGKQILIDGGPSKTQVLAQLGKQMPFWDRTLDLVVLTHPDADHVNGLVPVLKRFQVAAVLHRQIVLDSDTYAYWLALVEAEGAAVYEGQAGLSLTLDPADAQRPSLEMTVLHPGAQAWEGVNDNSVVARLTYGDVSLLLTGDIEAEVEEGLVRNAAPLTSTILKAAHHGSCSSTTQAFLDAVDPELVVISVGVDNPFGHPCDEVLERLEAHAEQGRSVPVYRTDEQGAVEIVSDGARVWVEVEK